MISSFGVGGAERVASDLAAAQAQKGHRVFVAVLKKTKAQQEDYSRNFVDQLHKSGVEAADLSALEFRFSIPIIVWRLLRLIAREQIDIVHAHADPAEFVTATALRIKRFNTVRTVHNSQLWPVHKFAARWSESAFQDDYVVAVSQDALAAHESLRRGLNLRLSGNRRVVENGIPIASSVAPPATKDKCARSFVFLGRAAPQKGLDILLSAISELNGSTHPPFFLDIFSGVTERWMQTPENDRIQIRFNPPSTRAREIMGQYDVVVVPSRFEGLPLVPLEAMSVGVPVVMSDAPGIREVTPPGWPLVFPNEDHTRLSHLIRDLSSGVFNLADLSGRAKEFAGQFDIKKTAEIYEGIYRTVVAQAFNKGISM